MSIYMFDKTGNDFYILLIVYVIENFLHSWYCLEACRRDQQEMK